LTSPRRLPRGRPRWLDEIGTLRLTVLVGLLSALAAYDSLHQHLWDASTWWDVAFLGAVLIPASFLLVWLILPLRDAKGLLPVGIALGFLTYAFHAAGSHTPENLCKLVATTLIGFWFLGFFDTERWVVAVALMIPWVDAYSVWRGPTKVIVTRHEQVFTTLSYAFPIPGEVNAANLGLPDLLFFAVFLAAAAQFGLRVAPTWFALTVSFGATIAFAVGFSLNGLPALPLLSLGFLAPNVDRLWPSFAAVLRRDDAKDASEAKRPK
jgi:hypothetical protein